MPDKEAKSQGEAQEAQAEEVSEGQSLLDNILDEGRWTTRETGVDIMET